MRNLFDAYLLGAILMIFVGIIFGVVAARKFGLRARLWWIGAAGFVISQAGHIPFNGLVTQLFASGTLPAPAPEWSNLFNAAFLGLSAGLFEELTRAALFRWWAKDARSWRKGVLFGAGWGGMEAILIGALALYSFIYMTALRGMDLSAVVPPEQLALATQQVEAYWAAPVLVRLLGALERLLTVPVQIALSVIVLQAFTRRGSKLPGWMWIILAILWHAVIDGVLVYMGRVWANQSWNLIALEGMVAVFSLISIGILFALRQPELVETPASLPEGPAPRTAAELLRNDEDQDAGSEDLDSSRFA